MFWESIISPYSEQRNKLSMEKSGTDLERGADRIEP
jgi:hypothetical protein